MVLEALPGESQRPSVEKRGPFAPRPSRAERIARGEAVRKQCPRSSHAVWGAPHDHFTVSVPGVSAEPRPKRTRGSFAEQ